MNQERIQINLSEICFTEHFSVDPRDVSYHVLNYEKYFSEIEKAKEKFSDKIKIKVQDKNEFREAYDIFVENYEVEGYGDYSQPPSISGKIVLNIKISE